MAVAQIILAAKILHWKPDWKLNSVIAVFILIALIADIAIVIFRKLKTTCHNFAGTNTCIFAGAASYFRTKINNERASIAKR